MVVKQVDHCSAIRILEARIGILLSNAGIKTKDRPRSGKDYRFYFSRYCMGWSRSFNAC